MIAQSLFIGIAAAGFALCGASSTPSMAAPKPIVALPAEASPVQPVDYKKRRWWKSNGEDTHVRAPTTSVDTNDAYTDVDAPFTTVRKSPRGTWVRAPFVNLFVPRD